MVLAALAFDLRKTAACAYLARVPGVYSRLLILVPRPGDLSKSRAAASGFRRRRVAGDEHGGLVVRLRVHVEAVGAGADVVGDAVVGSVSRFPEDVGRLVFDPCPGDGVWRDVGEPATGEGLCRHGWIACCDQLEQHRREYLGADSQLHFEVPLYSAYRAAVAGCCRIWCTIE